ncbi:Predicted ATP-dependent endonuclease of the OLD family, contains P-loop ATPase and TOPRIM domains [Blastococcus fimeti]|nr:Predicted ATP-dependent endonuclease of the OLD family, contains P-loop ATPase and TOPRIM domains [Blastococcus fimeti]
MRLRAVDVRFYKSFNFDYERKARKSARPKPWEDVSEGWFPFVRVDIDPRITAVVGANEAGKSHLLGAVKALLTGDGISRRDFCRYSTFFSVERGAMRSPEFGGIFEVESEAEASLLSTFGIATDVGREFSFYRPGELPTFLLGPEEDDRFPLTAEQELELQGILPTFHELRTDLAIPDSMSIRALAGEDLSSFSRRKFRDGLLDALAKENWDSPQELGIAIFPRLSGGSVDQVAERKRAEEFALGRKLLTDVAGIDPEAFKELSTAIRDEHEGHISGLVRAMNAAISRNLNFPRWWTQDRDFDLRVEARERELAFTIRDRTGTDYSFGERSKGLQFFLSYLVQLRAHRPQAGRHDVLLLDEPDAYLSSSGQQDLLRVLEDYSFPEDSPRRDQVIYVTHSPFLINRNAGERIRVLDKGVGDEGTRVVRDATKNHYEPLRSSLGAYVAETAFIGGSNLFVEGVSDQVLLAGVSSALVRRGVSSHEVINLNEVTIVAAGSASAIPYMVYLARGRDQLKPPCVVLLDGDKSGKEARKALRKSAVGGKRVLSDGYIVMLDEWVLSEGLQLAPDVVAKEIEDLIPLPIAAGAARRYAEHFGGYSSGEALSFTTDTIAALLPDHEGSVCDALSAAYASVFPEGSIDKVGFVREVVTVLDAEGGEDDGSIDQLLRNFSTLLGALSEVLARAELDEAERREMRRLDRAVNGFLRDETSGIRKDRARGLLREIDYSLTDSRHSDNRRNDLAEIRREFEIEGDLTQPVPRFEDFRQAVERLKYADRIEDQDAATVGKQRPPVDGQPGGDGQAGSKPPRKRRAGSLESKVPSNGGGEAALQEDGAARV